LDEGDEVIEAEVEPKRTLKTEAEGDVEGLPEPTDNEAKSLVKHSDEYDDVQIATSQMATLPEDFVEFEAVRSSSPPRFVADCG
jgi:hypothetical protein